MSTSKIFNIMYESKAMCELPKELLHIIEGYCYDEEKYADDAVNKLTQTLVESNQWLKDRIKSAAVGDNAWERLFGCLLAIIKILEEPYRNCAVRAVNNNRVKALKNAFDKAIQFVLPRFYLEEYNSSVLPNNVTSKLIELLAQLILLKIQSDSYYYLSDDPEFKRCTYKKPLKDIYCDDLLHVLGAYHQDIKPVIENVFIRNYHLLPAQNCNLVSLPSVEYLSATVDQCNEESKFAYVITPSSASSKKRDLYYFDPQWYNLKPGDKFDKKLATKVGSFNNSDSKLLSHATATHVTQKLLPEIQDEIYRLTGHRHCRLIQPAISGVGKMSYVPPNLQISYFAKDSITINLNLWYQDNRNKLVLNIGFANGQFREVECLCSKANQTYVPDLCTLEYAAARVEEYGALNYILALVLPELKFSIEQREQLSRKLKDQLAISNDMNHSIIQGLFGRSAQAVTSSSSSSTTSGAAKILPSSKS